MYICKYLYVTCYSRRLRRWAGEFMYAWMYLYMYVLCYVGHCKDHLVRLWMCIYAFCACMPIMRVHMCTRIIHAWHTYIHKSSCWHTDFYFWRENAQKSIWCLKHKRTYIHIHTYTWAAARKRSSTFGGETRRRAPGVSSTGAHTHTYIHMSSCSQKKLYFWRENAQKSAWCLKYRLFTRSCAVRGKRKRHSNERPSQLHMSWMRDCVLKWPK